MAAEDDLDLLAAEYVLGLLSADECTVLERRLAQDPKLAARVEGWQARFAPLGEDATPVTPRPQVWQRIRRSIGPGRSRRASRSWSRPWFWRGWAALATAAVLALAVFTFQPAPAPQLVAVLTNADGDPIWVVGAAPEGLIRARPLASGPEAARVPELWLLPVGAQRPVSLGVLDPAGDNRRSLQALPPDALQAGGLLEVSLEPPGGSPTGLPTGPVISKGFLVAPPR